MLSICIVSWNVSRLLKKCLSSIYGNSPKINFEVIVVDNASYDDSVQMIHDRYPRVKLIENKKNVGFSAANNQAIKKSLGDYILILNPDTEILSNSLDNLVDFIEKNIKVGAVAPKLLNSDRTLQRSCLGFPTLRAMAARQLFIELLWPNNPLSKKYLMNNFKYDEIAEIDQPMGACILFRKKTLDEVGLFDERSFMFFDEVDLLFRIKKADWKIFFVPASQIIHHGGSSIKKWGIFSLSRNWTKSRNLFFLKHYGRISVLWLHFFDIVRIFLILFVLLGIYKSCILAKNLFALYFDALLKR